MSSERLNLLRSLLEEKDWCISAGDDCKNIYQVCTDEHIHWILERPDGERLDLRFYVVGELGERSLRLEDILYCKVIQTNRKLIFMKIKSPEWQTELTNFVNNINKSPHEN